MKKFAIGAIVELKCSINKANYSWVTDSVSLSMQSNLHVSACLSSHVCASLHECTTQFDLFIQFI